MTIFSKLLPYSVITLDLGDARSDLAQGSITLRGTALSSWLANVVTIITLDGGSLSFKLGDSDNDSITASDNMKHEGPPFSEIYWTNTAQPGLTAEIYVTWVD